MTRTDLTLGILRVTSGRLLVIDPCYPGAGGIDGINSGVIVDVPPGEYPVTATDAEFTSVAVQVSANPTVTRTTVGRVSVDSGQVMFLDVDEIGMYGGGYFEPLNPAAPSPTLDSYPFDYTGACLATLSEQGGGELGEREAVATRTAYGDGSYDLVLGYDTDGNVTTVTILFDE